MGQPSSKCYFGGFAFFDFVSNKFEETLLMCNRYSNSSLFETSHDQRSIFSSNSSIIIVLYQYKEYSSMEFTASIHLTNCIGLKIHPCSLRNFKQHNEDSLSYSHLIRLRRKNREDFYLTVLQKRCMAFQFSSETDLKLSVSLSSTNEGHIYCSLVLEFEEVPVQEKLWELLFSGFFPHSLPGENHLVLSGAIEHASLEPIITEWNETNNKVSSGCHEVRRGRKGDKTFKSKTNPMCRFLFSCFNRGFYVDFYLHPQLFAATFSMHYFVISTIFSGTMSYLVEMPPWSTGWVNVILNPTDETPSNTYIELAYPEELREGSRYFKTVYLISIYFWNDSKLSIMLY